MYGDKLQHHDHIFLSLAVDGDCLFYAKITRQKDGKLREEDEIDVELMGSCFRSYNEGQNSQHNYLNWPSVFVMCVSEESRDLNKGVLELDDKGRKNCSQTYRWEHHRRAKDLLNGSEWPLTTHTSIKCVQINIMREKTWHTQHQHCRNINSSKYFCRNNTRFVSLHRSSGLFSHPHVSSGCRVARPAAVMWPGPAAWLHQQTFTLFACVKVPALTGFNEFFSSSIGQIFERTETLLQNEQNSL